MRSLSVAAAIFAVVFSTQLINSILAAPSPTAAEPQRRNPSADFIRTSCKSTMYPMRCYRTLSPYASEIGSDPKKLAMKALNVTLKVTKSASKLMKRMSRIPGVPAALADCVEEVEDAVDELGKSIGEMGGAPAQGPEFCRMIGDVQTWVSAAETDDDTCTDGFEEVPTVSPGVKRNVKKIVEKHVGRIARFTSNALALVNLYASSSSRSRHVKC
ncbi:unnamed protein product [Linum tenue]|uniref:Pectinesterase inhibitor domain-containing protein n=1 Tax=Linum tenue TaxID=586396 RepID=A0AAV0JW18_9ROSI|nr:unnamed protein product [Linum tenue]